MARKNLLFILFFLACLSVTAQERIDLRFPIVDMHSDYYTNLLEASLRLVGREVQIERINMPANRAKAYLADGKIDIFFLIESNERNEKFIPIPVGLTNGLIAKRVLFLKKGDNKLYSQVENLEDFRNLNKVVGMGSNWFDVKVWEANDLLVYKFSGEYTLLFRMLAAGNRGIDYYSTGLNEAMVELEKFGPLGLEIEPRLMLIYERDYIFYMSQEAGLKYKNVIEEALSKAKETGLIERMIRAHWAKDLETLNYDNRIKIYLETPE